MSSTTPLKPKPRFHNPALFACENVKEPVACEHVKQPLRCQAKEEDHPHHYRLRAIRLL